MSGRSYSSGVRGEEIARDWLCRNGMTCLEQRYRGGDGEIDLIMEDDSFLVFVEVKYRPESAAGSGLMAVTPAKKRRMIHAAMLYAVSHHMQDRAMRFDVIEITRDGVLHIPDAFRL